MTSWTDERLEDLLGDTFRAHEHLADPDRAIGLADAGLVGRRRWPVIVAAAAAVVVVAAGTSYVVARNGDPAPSVPADATSPTLDPGPRTTEENIAATHEQSAWLLHAVPMPPGSRELAESPNKHYRGPQVVAGPSDPAFGRTTWWTVPLPTDEFADWLSSHQPEGLEPVADEDGGTLEGGEASETRLFAADETDAWTRPVVAISYMPFETQLAVRVETLIGARSARTAYIPEDITRVSVLRTERSTTDDSGAGHRSHRVTDAVGIADLVALVNDLPGSMTVDFAAPCPASMTETEYRLRFASADGSYRVRFQPRCWGQATLVVNGKVTAPTLDPGAHFARALDGYLRPFPGSFRRR